MRKLVYVVAATVTTLGFQNCAKANFAASNAASVQSATGELSTPLTMPTLGSTVCADFGTAGADCDTGHAFVGELYVEPRDTLIPRSHGGGTVLAGPRASLAGLMRPEWLQGVRSPGSVQPYRLVASSFDLTGQFSNNFHTVDGSSIMVPDADGKFETVSAWFALSMRADFHLDARDAPGADYQFALISDDGSQLQYRPDGRAEYVTLVDNETPEGLADDFYIPGTQFVRMGCGARLNDVGSIVRINVASATQTIPLKLNYFNGPQGLTLHLLYRRVPADGAADGMCETDTNVGDHKSAVVKASPSLAYADLAARGWKVVGAANL